jgi:hypothetical protein
MAMARGYYNLSMIVTLACPAAAHRFAHRLFLYIP